MSTRNEAKTTSSPNFEGLNRWGELTPLEQETVIELVNHIASDHFASDTLTTRIQPDTPSGNRQRIVRGVIQLFLGDFHAFVYKRFNKDNS